MKGISSTRKLVSMGLLAAISVILVLLIHVPVFPVVPFLEYDPADVPIIIATFAFGPVSGFILTVVVSILQGITVSSSSGIYGIIMHIFSTGSYSLASGIIYKKHKTRKGAIVSLVAGTVISVITMSLWNLIITPLYMGQPLSAITALLPWIIAFNVVKSTVNSVISYVVYKPVSRQIKKIKD